MPNSDQNSLPKKGYSSKDDYIFSLRFKADEWVIISEDIKASGLPSKNAYFRQLALESPVPRKRHLVPSIDDGISKIYGAFLGQLGKVGSNLNQLTRQVNIAMKSGDKGLMPKDAELSSVLAELIEFVEDFRAELKKHAGHSD